MLDHHIGGCPWTPITSRLLYILYKGCVLALQSNSKETTTSVCNYFTNITVQYITVKYSSVQYTTEQYSNVQYSTVQHITVQYSSAQYTTVQ